MKESRRARRMQRHYRRMSKPGGLNLTALMDIFTILVFFLMVNSSDVKVLDQNEDITLPKSEAETVPEDVMELVVAGDSILLKGREVASIDGDSPSADDEQRIEGLYQALMDRIGDREVPEAGFPAMIIADREMTYAVLRPIMRTAVDAGFRQLHLAVEQRSGEGDGE